mgnify:CR=1 FL=1
MTVCDIRNIVPGDITLWIQEEDEKYCEANEAECLSRKYDDKEVKAIYPEHYRALGCTGITVII